MAYNVNFNKEDDLVFFDDAVLHLSRICRVLRQPRGNVLLVGVGGSGRQSLTRLAAFMADMKLYMIAVTRGYGIVEFREDLKKVLSLLRRAFPDGPLGQGLPRGGGGGGLLRGLCRYPYKILWYEAGGGGGWGATQEF